MARTRKRKAKRKPVRRNPVARTLRTSRFRGRAEPSIKAYRRRPRTWREEDD